MAAEFPLPHVLSTNPIPSYFEVNPEEFVVGRTIYDDNGLDTKLQHGGAGRKSWTLKYGPISLTQAAILDNWVATMFYDPENGSAVGANFREHIAGDSWTSTAGTLFANVHIAPGGYKKSHGKVVNVQYREFILEKRP